MMQEVRVHRWCDVCHADNGALVEVAVRYTISLSVEGRTALVRQLETCDVHAKPIEELRELLKLCGIQPPATERQERQARPTREMVREVPREPEQPELPIRGDAGRVDCGICGVDYARSGLIKHLVSQHNVKPIKHPAKCPECGAKHSGQAMVMHRRSAHHYDQLADMMAQHRGKK